MTFHILREVLVRSLFLQPCPPVGAAVWYLTQFLNQNHAVALARANTIMILMEGLCSHIFMIMKCEIQNCTGQGKKKTR